MGVGVGWEDYQARETGWLAGVSLGLTLWEGSFEGKQEVWLRWCDETGTVIPTGAERANQERQRADQSQEQMEQQWQRAERLAQQLRDLGLEPLS